MIALSFLRSNLFNCDETLKFPFGNKDMHTTYNSINLFLMDVSVIAA